MQFIFIRHLPTAWNQEELLQGQQDTDILPLDAEQQRKIAVNQHQLRQYGSFDVILTSTLKRTRQSAQHYQINPNQIVAEPLLNELNFGHFEGKKKELLIKELGKQWQEDPRDLILGESLVQLQQRIQQFIEKYQDYQKVLCFAHGAWLRAFISIQQHGNLSTMNQFMIPNNELIVMNRFNKVSRHASK